MTPAQVRDEVRAWRQAKCAESCPKCPINCCTGRLNPRLDSLDAFESLPIVRGPRDSRPLNAPYVRDRRFLFWGHRYLVGRCPHLAEGKCAIYDDPRRPSDCHEYPMHVQKVLGGEVLNVETSCWIFQQPENREAVRELGRQVGLECVFHEDRASQAGT